MSQLLKSPPKRVTDAARRSSTSTGPSVTGRGKSRASRAGSSAAGRQSTACGIMTLTETSQGPRYRLHVRKRELLDAARKLLRALAQSLPESSGECEHAQDGADAIDDLLRCFTWVGTPSDRAENQLPVGDRLDS
jgi:hypothetical protein